MDPKKIALLVGALIIAAISAIMAKSMWTNTAAPAAVAAVAPVENGPEVLVATRALPIGTIIAADSFRFQPWPKDLIQNAYYLKGAADQNSLAGTVVRNQVSAGQPLTQGSLVKPGDRGFLAAALGPGMRAVTVAVSRSTGVGGFIFPGDRVDLILSQSIGDSGGNGSGTPLRTTETFVRNARVLATDQRTVPEDDKGKKEVKVFETVTLEVTPRIAEKIAVAQTIGQLSLSLRSIADNVADLDRAIASGDVKVPAGTDPKADKRYLIDVAARPSDTNTTWVTGADVSRFQRRSLPSSQPAQPSAPPAASGTGRAAASQSFGGSGVRVIRGNAVADASAGSN
jgi:Flp pilus assembly protein CpaB